MHSNNSSDNNNDYYHHHGDKGHHHRDKRSSSNSPNPCILYHHEGRHAGVWAVHPFESDGQTAICSVSSDGTFRCSYVSSSNCHHGTPHTASCSKSHIDRWVMQGFKIDKVQDTTESNSCSRSSSRSSSNSSYDSKDRNIDNRESFHAAERDSQMASNSNAGSGSGISMRSLSEAENSLISGSGYVIPNTTINSSSGSSSGCGSTDVPSGDHNNCAAAGGAPAATGGGAAAAAAAGGAAAGSVWCGPSADVYVSARGTLDLHSNQLKRSHSAVALHAVDSTSLTFLNSNASSGNYSRNDRNNSDNRNWNYDRTYSNDINNNSNSNSICNNNHDYSTTRLFAYGGAAGLLRVHTIDIHDRILN